MKRRTALFGGVGVVGSSFSGLVRSQAGVVKFGQSASFTGGQAAYGGDVRDGILAAFNAANKEGKGPRFELVPLDDGGKKERCQENVKKLIDSGVTALVGLTSGAGAEACLPTVEESKVVLLGTASGNMGIRSSQLAMPYHVRSGYDDEYRHMLSYVKQFNMQRVGYVYLADTSPANQSAMTAALNEVGLKLTESVPLDRNQKAFDTEVRKLIDAKLDCVLFTTNAQPAAAVVAGMSAVRGGGFYFSSSFAGQALIDDVVRNGHSIIMSQVVPRPNAVAKGIIKQCASDIAALGSATRMGFTSIEGYIVGRVAVETSRLALKNGGLSRSRFKDVLSTLDLDLGGYHVRFTPPSQQGSRFVDVVAINRTGRIVG